MTDGSMERGFCAPEGQTLTDLLVREALMHICLCWSGLVAFCRRSENM